PEDSTPQTATVELEKIYSNSESSLAYSGKIEKDAISSNNRIITSEMSKAKDSLDLSSREKKETSSIVRLGDSSAMSENSLVEESAFDTHDNGAISDVLTADEIVANQMDISEEQSDTEGHEG